jgi:ribosomal protein S18 acetylase RimI-like enzyme
MLKARLLDESLQKTFWNHVNRDPVDYYFFILDVKTHPDQTKIWLAMEGEKVEGLLLVHRDYVVQLRGSREAVEVLLGKVSLKEVELQAPLDCEDIVLKKYVPRVRQEMVLMSLKKGEESIQTTITPARLGVEDAEDIAELMSGADPEWWGDVTAERIRSRMEGALYMGIKQEGKVVSVGMVRLTDFGSNISVIATHERYRNRGYATSIVSTLVKEILKTSETALIHVIRDNAPAVRAYSKVGYKPYRTYLSIRT